ncbi:MAG TPA: ATP-binding protein [Gemmataceae bacterium]|jgi:two-component system phosphate regulon sensor histidine kinase PhoR|nr:ATP-binding protein [Gemmataceae bacterium]
MLRTLILLYGLLVFLLVAVAGGLLLPEAPLLRVGLLALIAALIAMAPAFTVRRWFTQPLRALKDATRQITQGEYGQKVYAIHRSDVADLVREFNDMSEHLAEEFAQVQQDREQLHTILSGLVEGVIAIDEHQTLLFTNEKAAQLLEFHPNTAVGRKLWEVIRQKPILAMVEKVLDTLTPLHEEMDWKGATTKSLAIQVSPIAGLPDHGAIVVIQDISELRRLERLRQEFVANVSHELKSPLAVIKACVETLQDGAIEDSEVRGQFLEQINEHADRLHNLILDLMSLARIESGMETMEFEPVILAEIVAHCLERHQPRADAKNQIMQMQPPDEPAAEEIRSDCEALSQILDNLVDNSIKYTPEGGHIRVRWYGRGDQVCIEVEDTGIGIPEVDLPRIFERFYRVDKARSRELGGTGLGLAIVKNLARILRGNVCAESTLGKGSKFTVCLPRAPN